MLDCTNVLRSSFSVSFSFLDTFVLIASCVIDWLLVNQNCRNVQTVYPFYAHTSNNTCWSFTLKWHSLHAFDHYILQFVYIPAVKHAVIAMADIIFLSLKTSILNMPRTPAPPRQKSANITNARTALNQPVK